MINARHRTKNPPPEASEHAELHPRPGLHSRTGDPIDAWLTLLTGMLRLSPACSAEIRDELEDHIRTRVRDQLVEGVDEATAVRRAIDEVGEASAVAHRFRSAQRTPIRRYLMHATVLSVSLAALGVSLAAFTGGSASQPTVYESTEHAQIEGLRGAEITTDPSWSFEQFAHHMGDIADKPVYIHWRSLADVGIERGDEEWSFDVEIQNASFDTLMRLLNERLDWEDAVGVRTFEGRLEFASRDYLDGLTVKLVRYDIGDVIEAVSDAWSANAEDAREEIIDLIQTYVEMDAWHANGGALASLRPVGDQLFIDAPERFFPKIEWLLEQLQAGEDLGQEAAAQSGPLAPTTEMTMHPLKHTDATRVAELLKLVFHEADPAPTITVKARVNALVIQARSSQLREMERLIGEIDDPESRWNRMLDASSDARDEITVQPGDTLTSLAARYLDATSRAAELADANALRPGDDLEPGQVLRLPANAR